MERNNYKTSRLEPIVNQAVSQTFAVISNSHLAADSYSNKGKEQLKTSRLEPIGNQALSPTLMEIMESMEISSTLFDFRPRSRSPRAYSHRKNVPKTPEELLSTAPPYFLADDPEILMFPPELAKLS